MSRGATKDKDENSPSKDHSKIEIDERRIEIFPTEGKVTYLGHTVTSGDQDSVEVQLRIRSAWSAFATH